MLINAQEARALSSLNIREASLKDVEEAILSACKSGKFECTLEFFALDSEVRTELLEKNYDIVENGNFIKIQWIRRVCCD